MATADRSVDSPDVPSVVACLRRRAEEIRRIELDGCERRLTSLHERDAELVDLLTAGIVSRLIDTPTERIRQASGTPDADRYSDVLRRLFGLDSGT
jgi:glutamyl-tRNA reductase